MNRSQFNKAVVPGLFSFMTSSFKEREPFYTRLTTIKNSKRTYEESAYYAGLGLLTEKPEGEGISYDDFIQGPTKRWVNLVDLLKSNLKVIKRTISVEPLFI